MSDLDVITGLVNDTVTQVAAKADLATIVKGAKEKLDAILTSMGLPADTAGKSKWEVRDAISEVICALQQAAIVDRVLGGGGSEEPAEMAETAKSAMDEAAVCTYARQQLAKAVGDTSHGALDRLTRLQAQLAKAQGAFAAGATSVSLVTIDPTPVAPITKALRAADEALATTKPAEAATSAQPVSKDGWPRDINTPDKVPAFGYDSGR